MCRFDSADLEVDYSESEHFDDYFARNFKSWNQLVDCYRLGGGHIPSRHHFDKAKNKLKKNPPSDGLTSAAA